MKQIKEEGPKEKTPSEVKQLLLLLGSAIVAALCISLFLIHHYGPSGEYYVRNILLSPSVTRELDYRDGSKGGRFVFDRAEFRYFNDEEKRWKTRVLSPEAYRTVYEMLENQSSLSFVSDEVLNQFNLPNPAVLSLYVKNEQTSSLFQEIVFVNNGDLYRIKLRTDTATASWAYFSARNIYDHILHTIQSDEL